MRIVRSLLPILLAIGVAACVDGDTVAPFEQSDETLAFSVITARAASPEETAALGTAFDQVDQYSVSIADAQTLESIADTMIVITPGGTSHRLDIAVPDAAFGRTVTIDLIAFGNGLELYRSTVTLVLQQAIAQLPVELEIRYTGPGIRGRVADVNGVGVGGIAVDLIQGQTSTASTTTEADGTYVFVGVPIGQTVQVTPTPPQSTFICPGVRDVTLASVTDAVVADFRTQSGSCGIDVLVLSGGDFDDTGDVVTLLSGDPGLTLLPAFFYVNQLPTDSILDEADVIVLLANGLFDESRALGDRLAQYVGRGGNVVTTSFYWQNRSDSGVGSTGWGALEQLDAMASAGGANYSPGTLGTVVPHPLTTGVSTLATTTFWGGAILNTGATAVATWADGSPLVGYRVLAGGQRMVGVSLFPGVGAGATGDAAVMFQNAATWAGQAGGPALAN